MKWVEIALLLWLAVAAVYEWGYKRVPNALLLPPLAAAVVWRSAAGEWLFLVYWLLFYLAWNLRLIGGADAKVLMVTLAVWPTWGYLLWYGVWTTVTYLVWAFLQNRRTLAAWIVMLPVTLQKRDLERTQVFILPSLAVSVGYWFMRSGAS